MCATEGSETRRSASARTWQHFFFYFCSPVLLRRRLVKKYLCFFRPTWRAQAAANCSLGRPSPLSTGIGKLYPHITAYGKKKKNKTVPYRVCVWCFFFFFFYHPFGFLLLFLFYRYIFPIIIFPDSAKSFGNYRPVTVTIRMYYNILHRRCSFA